MTNAKFIYGMLCDNLIPLKYLKYQLSPKFKKNTVTVCILKHAENMIQTYNVKSNLSLSRCITPKRVTSLRGPSPRHLGKHT